MFKQISIFICAVQILSDECKCQQLIDLPSDSDEPPLPEYKLSKTVTPLRKYYKSGVQIFSKESNHQKFIDLPYDYDMVQQRYIPENKLSKTVTPSRRYLRNKSKYIMTPELLQNNIIRLKNMTGNSRRQFLRYNNFNTGKIIKKKVQTLIELTNVRIERTLMEIHDIAEHYKDIGQFVIGYLTCLLRIENKQLNDLYDYMLLNDDVSLTVSEKMVAEMINSSGKISRVFQEMSNKHNEITNNSLDLSANNSQVNKTSGTKYSTMVPHMNIPTVLPSDNLQTKRLPIKTHPPARKMYPKPALPLKNSKIARAKNPRTPLNSAVLHRLVTLYREIPTAKIA